MNHFIFEQFPVLETARLLLKPPSYDEIEALFELYREEETMKYYGLFPVSEKESLSQLIDIHYKNFDQKKALRFFIYLKESQEMIGTLGFHHWVPQAERAEVGYLLNQKHLRQGYMKEALNALIHFCFFELGLSRVEALTYPENEASKALLLGLGFQAEGLLRSYAKFRDQNQDLYMYGLLFHEYQKENPVHLLPKAERDFTYVILIAFCEEGLLWVRHKERDTLELPAGHVAEGECAQEAAERELWEETGALVYDLYEIFDYEVNQGGLTQYGRVYGAHVLKRGSLYHEIAEVKILTQLPPNLTYPQIQPLLYREGLRRLDLAQILEERRDK